MVHIITIFLLLFNGWCFYQIAGRMLTVRKDRWHIFAAAAFLGLALSSSTILHMNDVFNVTAALLGLGSLMFVCYEGSVVERLGVLFVLFPVIASAGLLFDGFFFEWYLHTAQDQAELDVAIRMGRYGSVLKALFYLGLYAALRGRLQAVKSHITARIWKSMIGIAMVSMVTIYLCAGFTGEGNERNSYLMGLACVVSSTALLFLLDFLAESMRIRRENDVFKLQSAYYHSLEEQQLHIRKLKHDLNNHLTALSGLLQAEGTSEAADYLRRLLQETASAGQKEFCENRLVNALLNEKYSRICEAGIEQQMQVEIAEMPGIAPHDLCILLGNTLDNAIEACRKISDEKKRSLTLKARTKNGFFSYSLVNSKCTPVQEQNGRLLTDKTDATLHGLGLQSVRDVVEKYGGNLEISYEENFFSVVAILPAGQSG